MRGMNSAEIDQTRSQALAEIGGCSDALALKDIERKYLGKSGLLAGWLAQIPSLPAAERPVFGQAVNRLKKELADQVQARAGALEKAAAESATASGLFDPTLPPPSIERGHLHPLTTLTATRPPEMWSAVATHLASTPGCQSPGCTAAMTSTARWRGAGRG